MKPRKPTKVFILYDGRAHFDVDSAAIMVTADSEKEARSYKGDYGDDCLWYEYEMKGHEAINGKPRPDL